jgi:hypothetical protein
LYDAEGEVAQSDIASAYSELLNSMDGLKYVADKLMLKDQIDTANELLSHEYTAPTWSILRAAVVSAQNIFENAGATLAAVADVYNNLLAARDSLVLNSRRDIGAMLAAVAEKEEGKYTASSWAALRAAATSAQLVYDDVSSTDNSLAYAFNILSDAFEALEERSADTDTKPDNTIIAVIILVAGVLLFVVFIPLVVKLRRDKKGLAGR